MEKGNIANFLRRLKNNLRGGGSRYRCNVYEEGYQENLSVVAGISKPGKEYIVTPLVAVAPNQRSEKSK